MTAINPLIASDANVNPVFRAAFAHPNRNAPVAKMTRRISQCLKGWRVEQFNGRRWRRLGTYPTMEAAYEAAWPVRASNGLDQLLDDVLACRADEAEQELLLNQRLLQQKRDEERGAAMEGERFE
jgi:hypothetical protein